MENQFFTACSVHLDGGLFGVVVEAKLASLSMEAMTHDAFLAMARYHKYVRKLDTIKITWHENRGYN